MPSEAAKMDTRLCVRVGGRASKDVQCVRSLHCGLIHKPGEVLLFVNDMHDSKRSEHA